MGAAGDVGRSRWVPSRRSVDVLCTIIAQFVDGKAHKEGVERIGFWFELSFGAVDGI